MARRAGKADPAAVRKQQYESKRGTKWKFSDGKNLIRVLPPWTEDAKVWGRPWHIHWHVGSRRLPVPCLQKHEGAACYLCELIEKLQKSSNKMQQKLAKRMRINTRFAINIIDMRHKNMGVQVCEAPVTVMDGLRAYDLEQHEGWKNITDPVEGYTMTVDRVKKGTNISYRVGAAKNATSIPERFLVDLPDLDSLYTMRDCSEQKALFAGDNDGNDEFNDDIDFDDQDYASMAEGGDFDDESEGPARSGKKRRSEQGRRRTADEDEGADEGDDSGDDDDWGDDGVDDGADDGADEGGESDAGEDLGDDDWGDDGADEGGESGDDEGSKNRHKCFGDADSFDADDAVCLNCLEYKECRAKVKAEGGVVAEDADDGDADDEGAATPRRRKTAVRGSSKKSAPSPSSSSRTRSKSSERSGKKSPERSAKKPAKKSAKKSSKKSATRSKD